MHKNVRIFFIVCFSAFVSSFIIQTIFQKIVAGNMSLWGWNPGWQREIAIWNVGCAIIAITGLKIKDTISTIPIVIGFTVLFALLGTNHLVMLCYDPISKFHWPPFIANYVGLFFGVKTLIQYKLNKL